MDRFVDRVTRYNVEDKLTTGNIIFEPPNSAKSVAETFTAPRACSQLRKKGLICRHSPLAKLRPLRVYTR